MKFDYRLRDGPATTRNAIRLLESYGYPPVITEEARREIQDL
jgi:DNA mismatch repair ATPase MutS